MKNNSNYDKHALWICRMTDACIIWIGRAFSWISAIIICTIVVNVILRYVFSKGMVMFEELQWYLFGIMIMIALSYGVVTDAHVRLSVLSQGFNQRKKDFIEALGIILLLIPLAAVILPHSLDFLFDSWRINESSDAPTGLCCRWFLKAFIPLGMCMLILAGLSRLLQILYRLRRDNRKINPNTIFKDGC
jgi:TRAP-type mannitol/chloroaromatic compound transport system permease small subunit